MLPTARFGFSLLEVLMAVMILALGIISIAALFPAGIAQQRMSNDDYMGPIVASHAMNVIRNKLKPEDFASFEEFYMAAGNAGWIDPSWQPWYRPSASGDFVPAPYFSRTVTGEWPWMRPGYIFAEFNPNEPHRYIEENAMDIFSHHYVRDAVLNQSAEPDFNPDHASSAEFPDGWPEPAVWPVIQDSPDPPLYGIPFARPQQTGFIPPRRTITQRERYYPVPPKPGDDPDDYVPPRPQYVWDCMFRRRGPNKVEVAIFVYRVHSPTAGSRPYTVQPNSGFTDFMATPPANSFPPIPFKLDLRDGSADIADWYGIGLNSPYGRNTRGAWDVPYQDIGGVLRPQPFVPGAIIDDFNLDDPRQSWQQSRQWLLDQNNNIHRVLSRSRDQDSEVMRIELTEPLAPVRVGMNHLGLLHTDANWHWNTVDTGFDPPDYPQAHHEAPFANVRLSSGEGDYYYAIPQVDDIGPVPFRHVDVGVVTEIFYIPRTVIDDLGNEWTLTPVYAAVKEL